MKKTLVYIHKVLNLLLIIQVLFFLAFAIISKLCLGRVLYFGANDDRNVGYHIYFKLANFFLEVSLVVVPLWVISLIVNIVINQDRYKSPSKQHRLDLLGVVCFLVSIFLIVFDPFGLIKYLID